MPVAVFDVAGGRIEGRKGRDGADEHAHRMSVMMEPVHEFLDVLVNHRVAFDARFLLPKLNHLRQFAEQEEVERL